MKPKITDMILQDISIMEIKSNIFILNYTKKLTHEINVDIERDLKTLEDHTWSTISLSRFTLSIFLINSIFFKFSCKICSLDLNFFLTSPTVNFLVETVELFNLPKNILITITEFLEYPDFYNYFRQRAPNI